MLARSLRDRGTSRADEDNAARQVLRVQTHGFRRPSLSARSVLSLQLDEQGAKEYITWAKKSTMSAAIKVANDEE